MAAVKKSKFDRIFDSVLYIILGFLALTYIYVLIYVVSASFSDPNAVYSGRVVLWPVDLSVQGYETVFKDPSIWRSYGNTIFYTVFGTLINVAEATLLRNSILQIPALAVLLIYLIGSFGGMALVYRNRSVGAGVAGGAKFVQYFRICHSSIRSESVTEPRRLWKI